ncbi:dimethylargininase isoform 1 [Galdieria sulphuraria]|uniref:Dimethylargininase isoform 1 n=1 Tax=Galdieria sulphuraria TaxID=130081 RepID=M2WSW3_GALSU|nr:dimethylargininase isoform 1 [Galdieria sulphuraria]EME26970.1 dimethylargininase isoform 1 [Galdieria sulphuraria]|eukprot:XP_005703490.1 dimethylargininase isoform 1 [Galdieria sulphuraria]
MEDRSSQIPSGDSVETLVVEDWVDGVTLPERNFTESSTSDIPLVVADLVQTNPSSSVRNTLFSRTERSWCRRVWFWFLVLKLVGLSTSLWLFFIGVPVVTVILSIVLPVTLLGVAFILAFVLTTTVARNTRPYRRQNNQFNPTRLRSFRPETSSRQVFPLYESSFVWSPRNHTNRVIDWSELGVNSRSLRRFLEGLSEGTIQSLPTYIFSSNKDKRVCSSVSQKEECLDEAIQVDPIQASYPWNTFETCGEHFTSTIETKEPLKDEISDENLSCAICLERFRDGECLRILPCFHQFHMDCIDPWLKRKVLKSIDLKPFNLSQMSLCYSCAILRQVANTFDSCIKDPQYSERRILLSEARRQHSEYCSLLSSKVTQVVDICADDQLPDCVFVEDTAVVVGNIAVITHPAPTSRRQEVVEVERVLRNLGLQVCSVKDYGCNQVVLDGGDVLWTGRHLFVGVGERTNREAVQALRKCFESVDVVPIILDQVMHLKSAVTFIPYPTSNEDNYGFLVVAETCQGCRVIQVGTDKCRLAEYYSYLVDDWFGILEI